MNLHKPWTLLQLPTITVVLFFYFTFNFVEVFLYLQALCIIEHIFEQQMKHLNDNSNDNEPSLKTNYANAR